MPPEFLLQELPPANDSFMRVVTREIFLNDFGECPQPQKVLGSNEILRRLTIVLALECWHSGGDSHGNDVPVPFIIDTGAPEFMYLGSGAVKKLKDVDILEDTAGLYPFRLKGTLCRGSVSCNQPFACVLPLTDEELSIRGDVRLNLLGLTGIEYFKLFNF